MLISDMFRDDALVMLSDDQQLMVQLVASVILEAFEGGDWPLARKTWEEAKLDADETVACWSYFADSRQRAYLKYEDRKYLNDAAE